MTMDALRDLFSELFGSVEWKLTVSFNRIFSIALWMEACGSAAKARMTTLP